MNAPWVLIACAISNALYARGWFELRARTPATRARFGPPRLLSFVVAWLALLGALASPLDQAAERALSAHMVQHMLLTMVAAPLFWLSSPAMPMLFGTPRAFRRALVAPLLATRCARALLRQATRPLTGLLAMTAATVIWHVPSAYESALRDPTLHRLEHFTMFAAALLFWLPVIEPFPLRRRMHRLLMVPYLVIADLSNTAVAAVLAFSSTAIYPFYAVIGAAREVNALEDQRLAAGIMWIPSSAIYLIPAMVITVAHFIPRGSLGTVTKPRSLALTVRQPVRRGAESTDLLRIPLIGSLLRSARARLALRCTLLMLALLIAVDGLLGSQDAPMNLAGTLPWTHWRGIAIIAILVLGNVACMACPLIAPRSLLRRWIRPSRPWPRALRSKYVAIALLVTWLVIYEAFDLWASPYATVWILLFFLVAATTIDLLFQGASFCKFVCPIGQYQMVLSTVSTREVRALNAQTCASCTTHDCLQGRANAEQSLPGCGLGLLLPKKEGNLDCTFCLDCVSACPHANIGIVASVPAIDLSRARWRSGLGTLAARTDVGVLAAVFTVGAIANAAGMTEPIVAMLDAIVAQATLAPWLVQGIAVMASLLGGVAVIVLAGATMRSASFARGFTRVALATIPLGSAVWFMHFGFHLVTGWSTASAATQRVLHDLAISSNEPDRIMSCCIAPPSWLLSAQLLALSAGLAATLGVLWWSIAAQLDDEAHSARTTAATGNDITRRWLLPACIVIVLWVVAVWIVFQPMEMRGTSGVQL